MRIVSRNRVRLDFLSREATATLSPLVPFNITLELSLHIVYKVSVCTEVRIIGLLRNTLDFKHSMLRGATFGSKSKSMGS